jgi:hypothetical protein
MLSRGKHLVNKELRAHQTIHLIVPDDQGREAIGPKDDPLGPDVRNINR